MERKDVSPLILTMTDKKFEIFLSQSVYWRKEITVNKELREEYEWIDSDLSDRDFAIEVAKENASLEEIVDGGKLTVDESIEIGASEVTDHGTKY